MLADIPLGARRDLVPGLLWLTDVRNEHGAMGLFGDSPWLLVALSLAVVATIAFALREAIARSALAQIGFGTVLGGAAGNVIDRATHGFVVDFIVVRTFYIFNIADACITVGLCAIAFASLRAR